MSIITAIIICALAATIVGISCFIVWQVSSENRSLRAQLIGICIEDRARASAAVSTIQEITPTERPSRATIHAPPNGAAERRALEMNREADLLSV